MKEMPLESFIATGGQIPIEIQYRSLLSLYALSKALLLCIDKK